MSSEFLQLNERGVWPDTKNRGAAPRAPWAWWTNPGCLGRRAAVQHNSAAGRAPWAGVCKQEQELMPEHLAALQRESAATAPVPVQPRGALRDPSSGLCSCVIPGPLRILGHGCGAESENQRMVGKNFKTHLVPSLCCG